MNDKEWESEIAKIPVETNVISSANILSISAGTTAIQQGDAGCGGRTLISIEDEGSTSWAVRVIPCHSQPYIVGDAEDPCSLKRIEILLGGNTEADTIAEALEFAAKTIREALNKQGINQSPPVVGSMDNSVGEGGVSDWAGGVVVTASSGEGSSSMTLKVNILPKDSAS